MEVTSFVSAMMAAGAMSSCFTESPHTYKAENGTTITYCNYKGEKKFPGNEWTSKKCEKCSCTADEGLKCCKAAQHHISYTNVNGDTECVQKQEGCEIKWVLKNNPDEACPKGKIPTKASETGGKTQEKPSATNMFNSDDMDDFYDSDEDDFGDKYDDFGDDFEDFFDNDDRQDHSDDLDDDFWR